MRIMKIQMFTEKKTYFDQCFFLLKKISYIFFFIYLFGKEELPAMNQHELPCLILLSDSPVELYQS